MKSMAYPSEITRRFYIQMSYGNWREVFALLDSNPSLAYSPDPLPSTFGMSITDHAIYQHQEKILETLKTKYNITLPPLGNTVWNMVCTGRWNLLRWLLQNQFMNYDTRYEDRAGNAWTLYDFIVSSQPEIAEQFKKEFQTLSEAKEVPQLQKPKTSSTLPTLAPNVVYGAREVFAAVEMDDWATVISYLDKGFPIEMKNPFNELGWTLVQYAQRSLSAVGTVPSIDPLIDEGNKQFYEFIIAYLTTEQASNRDELIQKHFPILRMQLQLVDSTLLEPDSSQEEDYAKSQAVLQQSFRSLNLSTTLADAAQDEEEVLFSCFNTSTPQYKGIRLLHKDFPGDDPIVKPGVSGSVSPIGEHLMYRKSLLK